MLQTTTAAQIEAMGPYASLKLETFTLPALNEGEVLIKVAASGLNRPDLLQMAGHYPAPEGASPIPGLEVAGTIVQLGRNVSRWKEGDKVMALLPGGGFAAHAIAHEGGLLPWPKNLTAGEAASLPEALFTAWFNLMHHGRLKSQETCLVHGASGGVGHIAVQLAEAFGARVIATFHSEEKRAFCESLGCDLAINLEKEDLTTTIEARFGKKAIDVVLDMLGGDMLSTHIDLSAQGGRIVQIAFMNGELAEVNLKKIMFKELVITGSTLRRQPLAIKAMLARQIEEEVLPLILSGDLTPHVAETYPFSDISTALERLKSRQSMGKIAVLHQD